MPIKPETRHIPHRLPFNVYNAHTTHGVCNERGGVQKDVGQVPYVPCYGADVQDKDAHDVVHSIGCFFSIEFVACEFGAGVKAFDDKPFNDEQCKENEQRYPWFNHLVLNAVKQTVRHDAEQQRRVVQAFVPVVHVRRFEQPSTLYKIHYGDGDDHDIEPGDKKRDVLDDSGLS